MRYTKYIIGLVLLILLLSFYNTMKEQFTNNKIILYGSNIEYELNRNDFFPLKKYKFYDIEVFGPKNYSHLKQHYGNDILTHSGGKVKKERILDFSPASIDISNYNGCTHYTKRCEFWKSKNKKIPPCCANHLYELLKFIDILLRKNNITYFIYWGTFLGALRHKGLIPWDTDIDIYINENDIPKLIKLKNKIIEAGYYPDIVDNRRLNRINYSKINTQHIDIFKYVIQ